MADIEVHHAEIRDGRVVSMDVVMKGVASRRIDRETALHWVTEGHSLFTTSGHGHHAHRGPVVGCVEVDGLPFLRTDTRPVASDDLTFPADHG